MPINIPEQIAKHFWEVHFGGNWTWVNLKETLADVTWQQATTKIESLNTIVALVFHINYDVRAVSSVLQGNPLQAHDKYSFDHPQVSSEGEWNALVNQSFADAENLTRLIEELPENKLNETFVSEKYGNYYRNLHGLIEHSHYHLGQIVIIKKLLKEKNV